METKFEANKESHPQENEAHPQTNSGVKDSFDPYMQNMNNTLCKDLSAIEEWPEAHNEHVRLTLSRVGDYQYAEADPLICKILNFSPPKNFRPR